MIGYYGGDWPDRVDHGPCEEGGHEAMREFDAYAFANAPTGVSYNNFCKGQPIAFFHSRETIDRMRYGEPAPPPPTPAEVAEVEKVKARKKRGWKSRSFHWE